ncbi:hypothetical protein [Microbulbifer sp. JMSA003]|uniref:hypothetical protein n=1 Tax=Microbulbifer sp. JMSA003 TaxID=3243369 RepID=UPI004039CCB4
MEESIYSPPDSELESTKSYKDLSLSERLAESRRQIEESRAIQTLNFVWGLRLAGDVIFIMIFVVGLISAKGNITAANVMIAGFVTLFFGVEAFCIIGYFRRKSWCQIPLHIFAAFSLLNIPVGTILSVLHYYKMPKVRFAK